MPWLFNYKIYDYFLKSRLYFEWIDCDYFFEETNGLCLFDVSRFDRYELDVSDIMPFISKKLWLLNLYNLL
jgi:hypothetical protein